ncbi:Armadillo-type fold containing protein [Cricetulus griseus]|nr:Armadillo-type fold containing protein [Cricetulus griseus]
MREKFIMESKDEVSDTDSGIILQSGPDSPVSPMKELTNAVRKQQRALEAKLEACLEELRRLCLREAELTGTLPAEYPLKPGEKAPKVRRRIGAAYKLDEWALHREDPLSSLERQFALQLQITEAAHRLCAEENLSRQVRRQRKHAALQEEKKLRELERCLGDRRRNSEPPPTTVPSMGRELSASDDSSLSDGLLLEEEDSKAPKPPPESPAPPSRPLPPQSLEGLQQTGPESGGLERAPIQNSPWKETSLDHPYEKPRKSSELSSESSSPATTPQDQPSTSSLWLLDPASYHVVPIRNVPGQRQGRTSAPATPEMQGRRGQSQSLRVDSFRTGLCQSEKEAYQLIVNFMEPGQLSVTDKLSFLNAVLILSSVVRDQANGNMNNYYSKTLLAKKIETLILEEPIETLDSCVRQQAMLCIVALRRDGGSVLRKLSKPRDSHPVVHRCLLDSQTTQALDDMLQALVMEDRSPDMLILQNFVEIILPWLMLSDQVHQQIRALGIISRLLRFVCNFSELLHMVSFSIMGRLIGTFSVFCLNPSQEISSGALEALYYLFTILVLQRSIRPNTETILKDLQKHFRGHWMANMQNLTLFFRKYLTPEERADVIIVAMEAMTGGDLNNALAATKMLKVILKCPVTEVAKVSEILQLIYYHVDRVTDKNVLSTLKKTFQLLVQSQPEEVILTLFKIQDQSQRGAHKSWEILASFPKGYQVLMEYLLQRLISPQTPKDQEAGYATKFSTLIVTRAIYELLLISSQRSEVQTFFASVFVALLFQISFLVTSGSTVTQDELREIEYVDPVSSSVEALKTLLRSSGYMDHMSHIQTLGTWELLVNLETHYDGVALLAKSLVVKKCWHNRPIFSFLIKTLEDPNCVHYFTALVFLTELLHCPDVAGAVDEVSTKILVEWFRHKESTTEHLFLQITEIFTKHKNTMRHFHILQPYLLSCCYSCSCELVMKTFLMLQRIVKDLSWHHASSFLTELAFTLAHFFEEESEQLRLIAFEIYGTILAKVSRMTLVFPLRHQILSLLILLVAHLKDVNTDVVEVCRVCLCNVATILGWSKFKVAFAKNDAFTILSALLQQERHKVLWFLKQSVALFKSRQDPIRQLAVWFTGQIIRDLDWAELEEMEEEYLAFKYMKKDPDPIIRCLTEQTFYILEAKGTKMPAKTPLFCLCMRGIQRRVY